MIGTARPDLAVVVTDASSRVTKQNAAARRLMGAAGGRICRDVVGGIPGAEGLPCREGCALELLASGLERARQERVRIDGRVHLMMCVPLQDRLLCAIAPLGSVAGCAADRLTPRERDVLRLLRRGLTTAAVARALGIRISTVRTHIEHMRNKLGVSTRAGLMARAHDAGLGD
ncbi:MAG: helix-turn-helix transcriptional regulator [Sandaracinaceae bacterium]|nr:helix-turn-helix transcriptional regulator [Sandaracinaceae bacterium]